MNCRISLRTEERRLLLLLRIFIIIIYFFSSPQILEGSRAFTVDPIKLKSSHKVKDYWESCAYFDKYGQFSKCYSSVDFGPIQLKFAPKV